MKRWVLMAATVTATALLCVLPTVLWVTGYVQFRPTSGWAPATLEPTPPLQVGHRYGFQVSGRYIAGRVLERPQGGWIKVEVQEDGKSFTVLLGLQDMRAIIDDPPVEWIQKERWQLSTLRQVLDVQVVAAVGNVP
jgi:hypothetical protein